MPAWINGGCARSGSGIPESSGGPDPRPQRLVEEGDFDPTVLSELQAREDALGTLARVFEKMAREVQSPRTETESRGRTTPGGDRSIEK